jgi:Tol biopolymer transport system component
MLQDISRQGTVLLAHEVIRREMIGLAPGESRESDLTWLGYSWPLALSRDGRTLFFAERSEDNLLATLYVRKTDGSPPVRLGEGLGQDVSAISPDGRWVFACQPASGGVRYELVPTGAGEAKPLAIRGFEVGDVKWFPDGEHLLVEGFAPGRKFRDYIVDLAGGEPRPATPEGVGESVISPDGKSLIATDDENGGLWIYPVEGGVARKVVEEAPGTPIQWSADGKSVYFWPAGKSGRVDKLDLASGKTELWKEFQPSDPTGVLIVQPMLVAPDGKSYVYTYVRVLSDLYLAEGLR